MKLNWAERLIVNSPLRLLEQRLEIQWMGKKLALKPDAVVLEIGCGRGAGAASLLKEFRPAVIHAMDLDLKMIRQAQKYLAPSQRKKISLYVGDSICLPHQDGSLDAVFDFGVLHHIPNWREGLSEIARVLKPGGVFALEELYPHLYQNILTKHLLLHPRAGRFTSQSFKKALKEVGLNLSQFLEINNLAILGICFRGGELSVNFSR
jgi:ubiquinone/menaquinone biosynthesis C-methylase UbiE